MFGIIDTMARLTLDGARDFRALLLAVPDLAPDPIDAEARTVDLIAELEWIKSAACALQADLAVGLDEATRARESAAGIPAGRRGRGVATQVALARHESPHRGSMLLGLARDLATDLPHTRTALAHGRLSEHAAVLVARETGCLDREQRAAVDAEVCALPPGGPDPLEGLGVARLVGRLRARVAALDPAAVVRRAGRAHGERHVSLRPAPDTMAYLTALLPVTEGVAAYAALRRAADTARATTGGDLSRGQVMADTLVQRLTGQAAADAVPVTVDLIISDATLLAAGAEPAVLVGHGPVPAQVAREIVARSLDVGAAWLRRLYADPSGQLVALTSRRRFAADGLAALLRVRDQGLCRTPWCDAPARHLDHVVPAAIGGPTTDANTQSLCERCNYARDAADWWSRTTSDDRHTVETTTPTGHTYRSRAPDPPRPSRPGPVLVVVIGSPLEARLGELLHRR